MGVRAETLRGGWWRVLCLQRQMVGLVASLAWVGMIAQAFANPGYTTVFNYNYADPYNAAATEASNSSEVRGVEG